MEYSVPARLTAEAIGVAATVSLMTAVAGSTILALIDRRISFFKALVLILPTLAGYSIPIGFVGYVAGYLTVYSRTSAVGDLLPAVLALIGGINIYVFGTDTKYRFVVAYCVFLFTTMMFFGTQYGAYRRESDRIVRMRELAVQEFKIRRIRENLELAPDPPSWILSSEPE